MNRYTLEQRNNTLTVFDTKKQRTVAYPSGDLSMEPSFHRGNAQRICDALNRADGTDTSLDQIISRLLDIHRSERDGEKLAVRLLAERLNPAQLAYCACFIGTNLDDKDDLTRFRVGLMKATGGAS